MKKKLLFSMCLLGSIHLGFSQTTIFEDNFDSYADFSISGVGGWTLTNVNTSNTGTPGSISYPNNDSPFAFIVYNSQTTTPNTNDFNSQYNWNWSALSGNKAMISLYKTSGANNDWLISPSINLAPSGNTLTFWAKSCSASYNNELFKVGVSTTNTSPASFTTISGSSAISTSSHGTTWKLYTYNLDNYAGQSVYISINCISNDQFGFAVDDFKITGNVLSVNESASKNDFKIYPNPATDIIRFSTSQDISHVSLYDSSGRKVKFIDDKKLFQNGIPVEDLNSGIYIIEILRGQDVIKSKIIKK